MDYTQSFAISAAGMAVERTRVDVAALNLANANTIQTPDGVGYQPQRVIARSGIGVDSLSTTFADTVNRSLTNETSELSNFNLPQVSVEPSDSQPRLVYEPGNPFANDKGFVTYPGVDTATEMVTLMSAMRSYEANVAAMNTARALALKTLDIGGA